MRPTTPDKIPLDPIEVGKLLDEATAVINALWSFVNRIAPLVPRIGVPGLEAEAEKALAVGESWLFLPDFLDWMGKDSPKEAGHEQEAKAP